MKITINGSPKELAELAKALDSVENEVKKADLPPLLTELAEDEKINGLAEDIRNAGTKNTSPEDAVDQKAEELARMVVESMRIFDD